MDLVRVKNILDQKHLLKELSKNKSRYTRDILTHADSNLVRAICEGILNILEGKVILSAEDKRILEKYKYLLRKLVERGPLKSKKKILIQKGGAILPFVLPSVLYTLTQFVGDLISKRNETRKEI
jgi:hypothetical protein